MAEFRFLITEEENGERIDAWLSSVTDYSRSKIQQYILQGYVLVDQQKTKANHRLKEGENIFLQVENEEISFLEAEAIPLDICYEDDDILVINKPKGLVVHPGAGHHHGTLVNALLHHSQHLSHLNGDFRPGIVHRLDKDTSGLLVCAKNDQAHSFLSEQLKDKRCFRKYYAIVEGLMPHNEGEIQAPIGRDKNDRQKMSVQADGKEAITLFSVRKRFANNTLLSCELKTGRTHQIRVHLAYIGYPVVNDPKYAKRKPFDQSGQYLHAYSLSFIHPRSLQRLYFETELPQYFQDYMQKKEKEYAELL